MTTRLKREKTFMHSDRDEQQQQRIPSLMILLHVHECCFGLASKSNRAEFRTSRSQNTEQASCYDFVVFSLFLSSVSSGEKSGFIIDYIPLNANVMSFAIAGRWAIKTLQRI